MPDPAVDFSVWKWVAGAIGSCITIAMGALWRRIEAVDGAHDIKNRDVWTAIEANRREHEAFKEKTLTTFANVTTKEDLKATEQRLMSAIGAHK